MENIEIKDLFKKDITRSINGVIKAENNKEATAIDELSEYVVTNEVKEYMDRLFTRYVDSLETPTEDMGVWLSGFFGSGKSHLLKMLGHIFENQIYDGKKTSEYFSEKIEDKNLFKMLENSSSVKTDVIMFNIDVSSDQDSYQNKDTIVVSFLKKFNEYRGFSRDDIKVAEFERMLWEKERFEEFKEEFLDTTGFSWESRRRNVHLASSDFLDVIDEVDIDGFDRDSAERWLQSGKEESISVDSFCDLIKEYLDTKDSSHRIIFLVDEIGQYIGDNSQLMLNLQTLVEQLGSRFNGRVWVGVTSQQDISGMMEDNDARRNDFSKIQGRFKTMISLSSSNIDEVIKKRLLKKKEIEGSDLERYYDKYRVEISNKITFERGATLKRYDDKKDFAETYPFVGYQFNLLQKVFEKVGSTASTSKHMSRGERSLLSSFQEAGVEVAEKKLGSLVPFSTFFQSIEQFLDDNLKRPFIHAKTEKGCDDFDVNVLKLLFLLKGIDEIKSTLHNIVSFMVDHVDTDRIAFEEKIKRSLRKLENQVLIQKDGDEYFFLTNEEQEINKEISRVDVSNEEVYRELGKYIFDNIYSKKSIIMEDTGNKYFFNRKIDDYLVGTQNNQLDIRIFTPMGDDYGNEMIIGQREGYDLIVKLPNDDMDYAKEIKQYIKIDNYVRLKTRDNTRDAIANILIGKQRENQSRRDRIKTILEKAIKDSELFIMGHKKDYKSKEAVRKIDEALLAAGTNRFNMANLIKDPYDENKIKKRLEISFEGTSSSLFEGISKDIDMNPNREAIREMENRIKTQEKRGLTSTLKDLNEYYSNKPYGWSQYSINGIVAELWIYKIADLMDSKESLNDYKEVTKALIKSSTKNLEKIVVKPKEEVDTGLVKKVNSLLREIFKGKTISFGEPKEDLLEILKDEKKSARSLEYDCKNGDYPGVKDVAEWMDVLDDIIETRGSTEKVLKTFLDSDEDLEDTYEKMDEVKNFYIGPKRKIYDKGRHKIKNINKYEDYIGTLKTLEEYKTLVNIIESKNPFSKIKDIPDLLSEIESKELELINDEKQKLMTSLESYKVRCEKIGIVNNKKGFEDFITTLDKTNTTDVFYLYKKLENIIIEIEAGERTKAKLVLDNFQTRITNEIKGKTNTKELEMRVDRSFDEYRNEIRSTDIENLGNIIARGEVDTNNYILEAQGKAKKKDRVGIKKVTLKADYNLETIADVERYMAEVEEEIATMKTKLLEAVKANKIVDIK